MGHLAICNNITLPSIIQTGYVSGTATIGDQQVKTVADIISSFLCIKPGDMIFPWIIHNGRNRGIGFKHIFICDGPPVFVQGNPYPFKIPIRRDYIEYANPVSEEEALDLFGAHLLWNAIGKKSLNRPRSITSQTPMEDNYLLDLLNAKNNNVYQVLMTQPRIAPPAALPLTINSAQQNANYVKVANIAQLTIGNLPWKENNAFKVEKALEAWFVDKANSNQMDVFLTAIELNGWQFEWVGNYMPFGIAGSSIDVVGILNDGAHRIGIVIELKKDSLSYNGGYRKATIQVSHYYDFITKAFASYGWNDPIIKVVLSKISHPRGLLQMINGTPWVGYKINAQGLVQFTRIV
jgi:hypothetical protein